MLYLFLFLQFIFFVFPSTTIEEYCIACSKKGHHLNKRNVKTLVRETDNLPYEIPESTLRYLVGSQTVPHYDTFTTRIISNAQLSYHKGKSKPFKKFEPEKKENATAAKYLTEKLFQLFRKLDLDVNNNLPDKLKDLQQQFNINQVISNGIKTNRTYVEYLMPNYNYDDNEQSKSLFTNDFEFEGESTTFMSLIEYQDETASIINDVTYYIDETTLYQDEIEFRQAKVSNSLKKVTVKANSNTKVKTKNNSTIEEKPNKNTPKLPKNDLISKNKTKKGNSNTKSATDFTKKSEQKIGTEATKSTKELLHKDNETTDGKSESVDEVTETGEPEGKGRFPVKKRPARISLEDEVVTIRRVKGIWIGGHCRCNFFIRSSSCKTNINSNLALFIIGVLLPLDYIM